MLGLAVNRVGVAVLAAIMWNSLSAGAEGARVLIWAADQDWWPGFEVEEEALTEVLAAATSIIEETPDFVHRSHLAQEAPNTEPPEGLTAMAVDPRAVETEPTSPEKPDVTSEEIRQGRAELDLHRSRAQQAITALNESLTEGARLHENELAALSAHDTGLEAWAHRLSLEPTDIRIADLDAVLERSEEHEHVNARLLSLLDLTDLSGITATQFAVLRGLIDQAREEQDTPLRAALMDLAELVELSAAEPDLLRMQALQSAIVATLPDELKGLPLAVIMRSQTATQSPVSPTEASSEESTESADASSDQVFVQESEPYEEPTAPELLKVAHATVDPITGRVSPPEATGPYDLVAAADLDGPATRADLVEAVALKEVHPDPDTAVECLDALGVFDRTEDDTYGVEPLLARCWRHREL